MASKYVSSWTKTEAQKLIKSELVIIPAKWGYQVGKYSVKNQTNSWFVYNEWNELIKEFSSKKSAVYWCVLAHTGRLTTSQTLLVQDTRLSKYIQDQINYQHSKQKAVSNGDYFAVDVCNARLAMLQSKLEYAKNDLEKTLNSAKYLKGIWEKPL